MNGCFCRKGFRRYLQRSALGYYLENPQNVDVKWTNLVATNLLKYFTITLSTDLRYDYDVQIPNDVDNNGTIETGEFIRGVRFAQTFGVGIGYKF